MELYKEMLIQMLQNEKMQISFPDLDADLHKLLESQCYQALCKIKAILADETLEDASCFAKIEEIVCAFESLGSSGSGRHDFG